VKPNLRLPKAIRLCYQASDLFGSKYEYTRRPAVSTKIISTKIISHHSIGIIRFHHSSPRLAMDPGMNQLLKWSIENSENPSADPTSTTDPKAERPSGRPINADALNSLFGGPSDADLMRESMAAILSSSITLDNKIIAFDNFEQLVENIDNANNLESLGLWTPLVGLLGSEEAELKRYAAWCLGTAVQNNIKAQANLLATGAIPPLTKLAIEDSNEQVRRKAIYALSSEMRNYQQGLDAAVKALPKRIAPEGAIDAGDMAAVDWVIEQLREDSAKKAA